MANSPPDLHLRLSMAAAAGLLPGTHEVASLQLPATDSCSGRAWRAGVAGDATSVWLCSQDRWWRVEEEAVVTGRQLLGAAAAKVAEGMAATWPGHAPPWLFDAEAVQQAWLEDGADGESCRVVTKLPALDGRRALGLLASMWQACRLQPPDDHVLAAIAASQGPPPDAVMEWRQGRLCGLGARVECPDRRTTLMAAGGDLRREHLMSVLAFRQLEAFDLLAGEGPAGSRFWAPLA